MTNEELLRAHIEHARLVRSHEDARREIRMAWRGGAFVSFLIVIVCDAVGAYGSTGGLVASAVCIVPALLPYVVMAGRQRRAYEALYEYEEASLATDTEKEMPL